MAMLGSFHVFQGIVAITKDDYFLVAESGLLVGISYTTLGWIDLLGGILILLAGLGLFTGKGVGPRSRRGAGRVERDRQFAFLDVYPLWAILMIAMNIVIIYAVTVHGGEMKEPDLPA